MPAARGPDSIDLSNAERAMGLPAIDTKGPRLRKNRASGPQTVGSPADRKRDEPRGDWASRLVDTEICQNLFIAPYNDTPELRADQEFLAFGMHTIS